MLLLPEFSADNFKPDAKINNQFFPLPEGAVMAYTGVETATGEDVEANDVFATSLTTMIDGVQVSVVRDTAYEDGLLAEETLDFYAQDQAGNVWYFGEKVINFEYDDDGNFIGASNDGGWIAGENGADPGWIMPAKPTLGLSYYNEHAPGVALDESLIVAIKEHIETDFGKFTTLETADSSSLEPGIVEYKYYAPGVGIVREEEEVENGVPGLVLDLTGLFRTGASHLANGTNAAETSDFVSDGSTQYVTVVLEDSEFDNSLGYYTFDPATGVIGEAKIIFSGDTGQAGDSIAIDVPAGMGVGFFLVADSSELGVDLSDYEDGGLYFENMLTGGPATLADAMAPVVTDDEGNPLPISAFHLLGVNHDSDLLNPGTGVQGAEWDLGKDDSEAFVLLGFEDHRLTDGDYDGDFNDFAFVFGDEAVDPADFVPIVAAGLSAAATALVSAPAEFDETVTGQWHMDQSHHFFG